MTKQDHVCGSEYDYMVQYYGDGKWYLDDDYDIHVPITYCPFCGQIPVPPGYTESKLGVNKCPHDVLVATGFEPPEGLSEHALWLSDISVHCKACGTIFMNFPSDDWVNRIENVPHYPQETCEHPCKYMVFPLVMGARFCLCCGKRWLDFSSPTSKLEIYPYHDCKGTPGYSCEICGKTLPKLQIDSAGGGEMGVTSPAVNLEVKECDHEWQGLKGVQMWCAKCGSLYLG